MKKTATVLIIAMLSMVTLPLQAAMISTQDMLQTQAVQQEQLDKQQLKALMDDKAVKDKMLAMGVTPEAVDARIDQMTATELAQLNQQLDEMPAGEGVLGVVVLIFVVFVITDVIGATDIFPFVHPVR